MIAANFTASAPYYDYYAVLQQRAAASLIQHLHEILPQLPAGPVLEIGCGTGAISKELVTLLPGRQLTLIDLSPGMIEKNRMALAPVITNTPQRIEWQIGDAESINNRNHYALITSSLTLQWFENLPSSLGRLCSALVPGGVLLCSYLGDQSFPEWRQAANNLNLPCTANPLPNAQQIQSIVNELSYQNSTQEEMIRVSYPTVHDFFRSLKKTGTSTATSINKLKPNQLTRLINSWQEQSLGAVTVTYQVNTLMVVA